MSVEDRAVTTGIKIWRRSALWFLSYVTGQTDILFTILHASPGGKVKMELELNQWSQLLAVTM